MHWNLTSQFAGLTRGCPSMRALADPDYLRKTLQTSIIRNGVEGSNIKYDSIFAHWIMFIWLL